MVGGEGFEEWIPHPRGRDAGVDEEKRFAGGVAGCLVEKPGSRHVDVGHSSRVATGA
jgi:hypothetical protein